MAKQKKIESFVGSRNTKFPDLQNLNYGTTSLNFTVENPNQRHLITLMSKSKKQRAQNPKLSSCIADDLYSSIDYKMKQIRPN